MSLGRFLHRQADKEELACEIEAHIANEAAELEQRGVSAEEARRQALLKFGNPTRVHEQVWESNSIRILESVLRLAHAATEPRIYVCFCPGDGARHRFSERYLLRRSLSSVAAFAVSRP
jgi:hypothetical protein